VQKYSIICAFSCPYFQFLPSSLSVVTSQVVYEMSNLPSLALDACVHFIRSFVVHLLEPREA